MAAFLQPPILGLDNVCCALGHCIYGTADVAADMIGKDTRVYDP
jgi:hypothetical protein